MASQAGQGAVIGSVVPGIGTAIGAGIGSLFGKSGSGGLNAAEQAIQNTNIGGFSGYQGIIARDFNQMFGRMPTQAEVAQLAPSYLAGGDATDPNVVNGQATLASYYTQTQNTPEALAAKQQADALAKYQTGQTGFDATTNQAFQQATGQAATSDELSHFGSLLATGQIDAYGLSQLVGQTQQAQQYQTQQYQNTLSSNLQATQGDYFKNYINPSILSQTAAAGRDPNSSGVQQAEVQAGKQQNYDLQNYLANFGATQYGQSAQNQQGVYQQYLNQQYGLQNAGLTQQIGEQSYLQNQNTNLQNYQLQQNAYNQYLSQYGNRNNTLSGTLNGILGGAIGGGKAGGPYGAIGGGILGGLGGYAGAGGNF